jgi:hypothetical protein
MKPRRQRALVTSVMWVVVLALLGIAAATAGAALASYAGLPIPLLDRWVADRRPPRGWVMVPISPSAIPAYTRLTRQNLWDPTTKRIASIYLPPEQAGGLVTEVAALIGRVLERDKPAGYAFTEEDFLPRGTRPGLVAGIPPGMRALRIEAEQIKGIHGLRLGDHFDLLATLPVDPKALIPNLPFKGLGGSQASIQAQIAGGQKQASVRLIAENAVVVAPVTVRPVPVGMTSLTGASTRTKPVQEGIIAVDSDEVAPVAESLAVKANLTAVPRSGRPDDPPDVRTAEKRPRSPVTSDGLPGSFAVVETITGSKRESALVPKP